MSQGEHANKDKTVIKKAVAFISVLVACLALLASGSLAYYVVEQKTHNIITSGNIAIEIHEYSDLSQTADYNTNDPVTVVPSDAITKVFVVENVGSGDAWIRVKVTETLDGKPDNENLIQPNYDTTNWTQHVDGCWYYNVALPAGAKSEPLFTHVVFDKSIENSHQGDGASVSVTAQAVQYDNNNENGSSVLDAVGWPEWN